MTKPISPLRQRMIDDMTMRNLSPNTHETYIRAVAQFSAFHRRSPDKLGVEHLREYNLHLVSRGLTANSICVKMGAHRLHCAGARRAEAVALRDPGRVLVAEPNLAVGASCQTSALSGRSMPADCRSCISAVPPSGLPKITTSVGRSDRPALAAPAA